MQASGFSRPGTTGIYQASFDNLKPFVSPTSLSALSPTRGIQQDTADLSRKPVQFGAVLRYTDNGTMVVIDDWNKMTIEDALEYLKRNYGQILEADRSIVQTLVDALTKSNSLAENGLLHYLRDTFGAEITEQNPLTVADIGNGGNPYPPLLLYGLKGLFFPDLWEGAPFQIHLVEPTLAFRRVIQALYGSSASHGLENHRDSLIQLELARRAFQNLMRQQGGLNQRTSLPLFPDMSLFVGRGALWNGAANDVPNYVHIFDNTIQTLPKERFHMATTFFVPCSISQDQAEFEGNIRSFVESVKVGGVVVGALMEGSEDWPAGLSTLPSGRVTLKAAKTAFEKAGVDIVIERVKAPSVREGDHGMLIFYGIRRK